MWWQWIVLVLFSPVAGLIGWSLWRGSQPKKARAALIVAVVAFLLPLLVPATAAAIKTFLVQPYVIPAATMEPAIAVNDRILVSKSAFRFGRQPARGDVVVFANPVRDSEAKTLVRRVVAVGGDTVDVQDGQLILNGEPLDEAYTAGTQTEPGPVPMPLTVAEGEVFLLGDNRPLSGDSRLFGPLPISQVQGKAAFIYAPASHVGGL